MTLFAAVFSDGAPTAAAATPILGDPNLEAQSDSNLAGQAEAFRTTASQTAQASTLNVYVSSRSSAATLQAGIYADGSGHPGVLLGAGSAHASPGGWSAVILGSPVSLKAGSVYWIAVLGPAGGGTLAFRDQQNRSGASETAAQTSLSSLPGSWTTGNTYADGPLSAYATGATIPAPPPDVLPPSKPLTVVISSSTPASVTLAWPASTDNVGVTGYGVYLNGILVGSTSSTSYLIPGLSCATAYTVAVDAIDAAGNRSAHATGSGSTAPCPRDTQPPSAPTALVVTSITQTTVSLAWKASSDNVGVTGYGVSNGGVAVGSTSSLGYTVTGLRCGTSYALAVDAQDAAGNHSATTPVTGSTSACSTSAGASVFVAPGGSDSGCVRGDVSRPCASFNRAFALAQGGIRCGLGMGAIRGRRWLGWRRGRWSVLLLRMLVGCWWLICRSMLIGCM